MNPWRSLRGLPPSMWVLALATLVNRAGTMFMPFLVLYLTEKRGVPAVRAGLGLAAFGAATMAMGPIGGRIADRVGAMTTLRASLVVSGLLLLAFPHVDGFPAMLALTAAIAAAMEPGRTATQVLVAELAPPEQRRAAFALNRLAANLGMSVGPAIGAVLFRRSFHLLFIADGATSLAAAAVLLLVRVAPAPPPAHDRPAPLLDALADPRLRRALAGTFAVALVFFQHESTLPLHLVRNLHQPETIYGLVFTVNTALIVALEVPLNAAMGRWPHGRSLALGALLVGLGFGGYALVADRAGVLATSAVWTFGEMVFLPSIMAHIAEIAPADRRGAYMGLFGMSFSSAMMVGPWVGGLVLERLGPTALWGAAGALGLLAATIAGRPRPAAA